MLQRLAPLLVATALLAGGCAAETVPDSEKIFIETTSSPLGPSKGDGKPKAKAEKPRENKGRRVKAIRSGISFRAPAGFTRLTKGAVSFAADSPRGRELAERTGFTPEQVRAMFESTDVFLLGFSGALTVGPIDNDGALPTEAYLRAELGEMEGTIEPSENVKTPLGNGRLFRVSFEFGGAQQSGTILYVLSGSTVVEISAGGPDADATLNAVIPTLKRA
ncbi:MULTISPECIES: hypothetical protein [unclassified Nocardioides]|uniref:hypothetical protein n=1 Tax=unclassified Nocardioides TaxID=2615069 RepID=UPI000701630E|nr:MULTISPECIES: hypothetical protein [unclassified Nocardioides]KRA31303.1 hypothetical protein ASD81_17810 [Nocardioides sp. Root614]KRA87924.1 hypothetical protein ASD84_18085 [Nocardioides sp. Root682]